MSRRKRSDRRKGSRVLPAVAEPERRVPRRLRVEGDLHRELAETLSQLEDPRLSSVSVTRVELTDDLQLARVFVRHAAAFSDDDGAAADKAQRELLAGLRAAAGRLRHHLSQALSLRYTPELRFHYDRGYDAARRVEAILDEIRSEK